ncbi:MAG: cupin domain-containing protein [Haloarculaceae archaeon]
MGYHVIDPDDVEPAEGRPSETHYLSEAAGLEQLGVRLYRVDPGEQLPLSGMHYHDEQEEAFYAVSGTLHVETPEAEYTVEEGSLFTADPGSPHRAYNPDDAPGPITVLALGAPTGVDDAHAYEG